MIHSLSAWGAVRHLAASLIVWTRPHSSTPATTDGNRIFMDPGFNQDEALCAFTHEAIHLEEGHVGCQSPAIEREVQLKVARRLITFEDLQRVAGWSKNLPEMADELGVTEEIALLRLQTLDGDQIQALWPREDYIA